MEGEIGKAMTVIKMRGSNHSKKLRLYEVGKDGIEIGRALTDHSGIINGVAQPNQRREAVTSA
jgi:circadian clock protein KaiC